MDLEEEGPVVFSLCSFPTKSCFFFFFKSLSLLFVGLLGFCIKPFPESWLSLTHWTMVLYSYLKLFVGGGTCQRLGSAVISQGSATLQL
jgi:hypothetical protein